ncbi:hypothetical protein ACNKHL_00980 [Shigella flexneri]
MRRSTVVTPVVRWLPLNGELIGINAILAPDGGDIGIGFALPSNMVKNLTSQMVEYGQVKRGELGIMGLG